jgi:DNA-binding PadR family transcriptional regulator
MTSMNMAWDPRWTAVRAAMRHGARMAAFAQRGPGGHDRHREHPHGRGGHRGLGPGFGGPGFGPPFGGPGFGGFGPRSRGRRGRRSRGDIRLAVLTLLAEQPRHGYEIIQEITERTGGSWRPSPGSVYPTLQQLQDEGLVRTQESEGRRTMQLTEAGTTYVEEHRAELDRVWDEVDDEVSAPVVNLRTQYGQLHAAVAQIMSAGTDQQRDAAANALAEARKTIYRLLAED